MMMRIATTTEADSQIYTSSPSTLNVDAESCLSARRMDPHHLTASILQVSRGGGLEAPLDRVEGVGSLK